MCALASGTCRTSAVIPRRALSLFLREEKIERATLSQSFLRQIYYASVGDTAKNNRSHGDAPLLNGLDIANII